MSNAEPRQYLAEAELDPSKPNFQKSTADGLKRLSQFMCKDADVVLWVCGVAGNPNGPQLIADYLGSTVYALKTLTDQPIYDYILTGGRYGAGFGVVGLGVWAAAELLVPEPKYEWFKFTPTP